ncbi:MAG: hypothetical protein R3C97_07030 [Geminicoccaceae bacterium]
MLTPVDVGAHALGLRRRNRDRLGETGLTPGALRRFEQVEHNIGASARSGTVAAHAVDLGDPGLELGVDGDRSVFRIRCRRLVEEAKQGRGRMLAFGIDEACTGTRKAHPPSASVGDLDAGQVRRAPLALDPAGDGLPVTFDIDVDDGTFMHESFGLAPNGIREKTFQICSTVRQHQARALQTVFVVFGRHASTYLRPHTYQSRYMTENAGQAKGVFDFFPELDCRYAKQLGIISNRVS